MYSVFKHKSTLAFLSSIEDLKEINRPFYGVTKLNTSGTNNCYHITIQLQVTQIKHKNLVYDNKQMMYFNLKFIILNNIQQKQQRT